MEKTLRKYWPIFLLPTLAAFCVGFLYPFLQGLYLSFCRFTTVGNATWNSVSNYLYVAQDEAFRRSFLYTGAFSVAATLLVNLLAFMIALGLTRRIRGTNLFRGVFFMPNLIGGIVLGYIWNILLNGVLSRLGKPLLSLNPTYGFWGLVILTCWQQIGYMMIIYIAGLQAIPEDYIEAARIDGAGEGRILWKIKIPNAMPSITICLFLTLTNSFKLFDQNLALTGGEPNHASEMLALNIYNTFYGRAGGQWKGYGQAKAVIFCLLVIILSLVQLRATRSKEVQQ